VRGETAATIAPVPERLQAAILSIERAQDELSAIRSEAALTTSQTHDRFSRKVDARDENPTPRS
jgi:hypothetical protein